MRGAVILAVMLVICLPATHAVSLGDLLKMTINGALEVFKREVMPVDGYTGVNKGKAVVIEGASFWNPDYYVVYEKGTIRFWGPIPRGVDIKVSVYKVYFGLIAVPYAEYEDIWWKKERVGDGWIGCFFIRDFDWRWGGESDIGKAYIAYNLPSFEDLSANATVMNLTVTDWDPLTKIGKIYLLR